ncbi:hypothetical protein [Pedobacter ginsengisoli]|uniref:hypothetical protein n=1 Tax=Pedobacter ginsengisoli TaxID=363852 RepID=UPI00254B5892|nr:hypothetical protein [Pedobacter ginsengisoli]
MKRLITPLLILVMTGGVSAQDSNILISLGGPGYGIKIKNNFPGVTSGFARAFTLSNEDGTNDFIALGVYGSAENGISTPNYAYLGRAYNNTYMVFRPNGNIGIGTINPTEKLSVKGKIRAQEVKVEMANWADFVFANDYVLPTLQETESHIKEKGHLPGIPSAAEVEKNGIELGDMNKKLLQKIEELTLYLIEQKKEIQTLNSKVENLQKNQKRY